MPHQHERPPVSDHVEGARHGIEDPLGPRNGGSGFRNGFADYARHIEISINIILIAMSTGNLSKYCANTDSKAHRTSKSLCRFRKSALDPIGPSIRLAATGRHR